MKINSTLCFGFIAILFTASCSPSGNSGLLSKKTQREKYEEKAKEQAGKNNPVVNKWLNAGEYSLNHPLGITANYSENGRFQKENQTATSLVAELKPGQKLMVQFTKNDTATFRVYMDLWYAGDSLMNKRPAFITAADTATNYLEYVAAGDEKLLLRFQQEIGASGNYVLRIQTGPSFYFPVAPTVKSSIGSVWGDGRDGGARKHEGIDIFAPKHSPAVAVAEGTITDVSENGIGGKVISMRPKGTAYSVYYAHLDSQWVSEGQHVYAGDVLGLTGNTGNAKFTVSHLHFGIYTSGGAIDPLLFVKPAKAADKKTALFPPKTKLETFKSAKLFRDITLPNNYITLAAKYPLILEAVAGEYYRVVMPDGTKGFIPANAVKKG